ncbi:putative bifunctional diguanylate cyclase/phosphodiesterase [Micromonospora fluostatini]|uniref:putative bifunctional diguanylate cyclase/phosphodiesterase n=1 Tax=Micromonospora sp. JCM 30529 TaxID=3421643 RepID=UPI003D16EC8A
MSLAYLTSRIPSAGCPPSDLVVLVAAALLGTAGAVALVPAPAAVALVGVATAAPAALRLARRPPTPRPTALLDAALLTAGLTTALPGYLPAAFRLTIGSAGLVGTAVLVAVALALLPGRSRSTLRERVRLAVDPAVSAVGLCLSAWVLLPQSLPPAVRVPAAIGAGLLAVTALTALTGRHHRPAAATCRGGATLALLGLLLTVAPLAAPEADRARLAGIPPLVVGVLVAAVGARRAVCAEPIPTTAPSGTRLRSIVPALVVLLVLGSYVRAVDHIETTVLVFGLGVVPPLVVRELVRAAEQRRYATRRVARHARLRALVAGARDLILLLDDEMRVSWQSPAGPRLFGLPDAAVVGRLFRDLVHPDDVARMAARLAAVDGDTDGGLLMARLTDGRGGWRETESTVSDQRAVPDLEALVLHVRDVGECRRLERTVRQLAVTDQLTGLANRAELLRVVAALGPDRPQPAPAGPGRASAAPSGLGGASAAFAGPGWVVAPVSGAARSAATAGAVRGVPVAAGVGRVAPPVPAGALLIVELHGLGAVNDGQGRAAGDGVLVAAAGRLRAVAGPRDLVARLTGDEFAVVTPAGPVPAYGLATRMLAALTEPYRVGAEPADATSPAPAEPADAAPVERADAVPAAPVDSASADFASVDSASADSASAGALVRLQVSIGLAEIGGDRPDDVLRQADLARRRAAQLGRDRIEWYDAQLERQLLRRLELERQLPGAVARGELDLVYQPVLGLADRFPVGTEALLRWRSPVLGTVLPDELLPVAESLGLVGELGRWTLGRACRQLADWSTVGPGLWMAVNVTPGELVAGDFVRRTAATLAAHGVPGDRLVVEVSEPQLVGEEEVLAVRLGELRALGVRTALDDFRAAHASLSHLRRLPIDLLKIGPDPVGPEQPLTDVLVGLGTRLGLEIVAECLESPEQVRLAHRAGCRYGQGYALARPATAERVEAYLAGFPGPGR